MSGCWVGRHCLMVLTFSAFISHMAITAAGHDFHIRYFQSWCGHHWTAETWRPWTRSLCRCEYLGTCGVARVVLRSSLIQLATPYFFYFITVKLFHIPDWQLVSITSLFINFVNSVASISPSIHCFLCDGISWHINLKSHYFCLTNTCLHPHHSSWSAPRPHMPWAVLVSLKKSLQPLLSWPLMMLHLSLVPHCPLTVDATPCVHAEPLR